MTPTDRPARTGTPAWILVGRDHETWVLEPESAGVGPEPTRHADRRGLIARIAQLEAGTMPIRWVWSETAQEYPDLLDAGVSVTRCHDLRLCHAIMRDSPRSGDGRLALSRASQWDHAVRPENAREGLFDVPVAGDQVDRRSIGEVRAELARQRRVLDGVDETSGSLALLCAAESAGALIACEMTAAGIPWDRAVHERLLARRLGARSVDGTAPSRLRELAQRIREALGQPQVNVDSPAQLLRALHRVGVMADSTARSELVRHEHPVIAPLVEYKSLQRLYSANGWHWLDSWVHRGRFHPVYLPAGVVTGRWAAAGGGVLQIPRELRTAVRADPGWQLVSVDVAQLEPRVMAAMARDERLAADARGRDLYAGIMQRASLESRAQAKVAVLGAMYGATTGGERSPAAATASRVSACDGAGG